MTSRGISLRKASASGLFGPTEAAVCGLMWGAVVAASESLTQPARDLAFEEIVGLAAQIGLAYCLAGVMISLLAMAIEQRLHGWAALAASALALITSAAIYMVIDRLSWTIMPGVGVDAMLTFVPNLIDQVSHLSWIFAFYGGAYLGGFFLFQRSSRARANLRTAERARVQSEARIDQALAEDQCGLLSSSLLLTSMTELSLRYTISTDRADRLLDVFVRYLRPATRSLTVRESNLATELEIAARHSALCRELGLSAYAIHVNAGSDIAAVAFPSLVLMRILDELVRPLPRHHDCQLNVWRDATALQIEITVPAADGPNLSEATERRARIALHAVAGPQSRLEWLASQTEGNALFVRLLMTVPGEAGANIRIATREYVS